MVFIQYVNVVGCKFQLFLSLKIKLLAKIILIVVMLNYLVMNKDGSTVRSEFAYYLPRTLNSTVPAYHTSVQFLKRIVPTYRTRTITKKAYRTS